MNQFFQELSGIHSSIIRFILFDLIHDFAEPGLIFRRCWRQLMLKVVLFVNNSKSEPFKKLNWCYLSLIKPTQSHLTTSLSLILAEFVTNSFFLKNEWTVRFPLIYWIMLEIYSCWCFDCTSRVKGEKIYSVWSGYCADKKRSWEKFLLEVAIFIKTTAWKKKMKTCWLKLKNQENLLINRIARSRRSRSHAERGWVW